MNKKCFHISILFLSLILLFTCGRTTQAQTSSENIKATLILQFCENITWSKPLKDKISIGFYSENTALLNSLKSVEGKLKIQDKDFTIKQISKQSEMLDFNVVYYKKTETDLNSIFKTAQENSILLITDNSEEQIFVMINIIKVKDKLSFKVNMPNLTLSGMNVKPNLLLNGGSLVDIKEAYKKFENQIEDNRLKIEQSNENLNQKETLLAQKDEIIQQKENSIEQFKSEIDLNQKVYQKLQSDVLNKKNQISIKNKELNDKDNQLQNISQNISQNLLKLSELQTNIKSLKTESDTLKSVVKKSKIVLIEKDTYIESQKKSLYITLALIATLLLAGFALIRLFITKKNHAKELEDKVQIRTQELQLKTEQFLTLFNMAPVAICEMNFSRINEFIQEKQIQNAKAFYQLAIEEPDFLIECFNLRIFLSVNNAFIDLFKISSADEIRDLYNSLFDEEAVSDIINEFDFLFLKTKTQKKEIIRFDKNKQRLILQTNWIDISELPNTYSRILVTMVDITQIRAIEQELIKHQNYLELLVKERTSEIGALNEELNSQNEELYSTNELLEKINSEHKITNTKLNETLQELKNAQMNMIQSEKMASLGILTAGIAHEINNPLNFIQTGIYALEECFKDKDQLLENLEEIITITQHMNIGVTRATAIVKSLNSFSRRNKDKKVVCDIHQIIRNSLIILNHEIKDKCKIIEKYEQKPFAIEGFEENLHQVFINIINNSVQSISKNGKITIATAINESMLEISIADNGEGISEENLKKIFDPFFTTKDPGRGVGIGLSIVFKIIEEHNGKIKYSSELQKGTTVLLTLPIIQD